MSEHAKQPLILGNWKMNGGFADNTAWVERLQQRLSEQPLQHTTLGVCPPFPYLYNLRQTLPDGVALGAQDVSTETAGAYTGETSADMLKELGCRYVLLGHSERRARMAETDRDIARKFKQTRRAGLTPVLCVGETEAQRDQNSTRSVIEEQLQAMLLESGPEAFRGAVIAYEPVWAIGTGRSASPEDIEPVHTAIFDWLQRQGIEAASVHVIYGGSLKAANADSILSLDTVDGGLIGGGSLKADDFIAIAQSAERHSRLTTV